MAVRFGREDVVRIKGNLHLSVFTHGAVHGRPGATVVSKHKFGRNDVAG